MDNIVTLKVCIFKQKFHLNLGKVTMNLNPILQKAKEDVMMTPSSDILMMNHILPLLEYQ